MIFRKLDSGGDWTFGAGKSNYAKLDEAIGLNVKTRILSWLNDCFFDLGAGIDWYTRLGLKGQDELLSLDLRRVILQAEGVTGIIAVDVTKASVRDFRATYDITTRYSKSYQDTITLGI